SPTRRSSDLGSAAALSDGIDRAGILTPAADRYPRRSHGYLSTVASHAALSGAPPGEVAGHPGEYLLKVRRHQSRRQPQAEYRGAAGVLQQARRHEAAG